MVAVVQLVRASDCGSECRGFESHLPPIRSSSSELLFLFPPISQARSRAHPARSRAHPTHSRAHPARSWAHPPHSRAHLTLYQHHPAHSRAHPTHSHPPTPSHRHRPRKTRKHPTPSGAHPSEAGGYLGKAGGRPGKTGGYLHAAADHLGRRASSDTSFRIGRNEHPYRPIRTSAPSDTRQQ